MFLSLGYLELGVSLSSELCPWHPPIGKVARATKLVSGRAGSASCALDLLLPTSLPSAQHRAPSFDDQEIRLTTIRANVIELATFQVFYCHEYF